MLPKHHCNALIVVISILLAFISCSKGNYSVYRSAILNYYPKGGSEHIVDPVQEIDPINDKDVIVYIALDNRQQTYNIEYKLFKPDGKLFRKSNDVMKQEGPFRSIYNMYWIKTISMSMFPGQWKAEIYIDGTLAKTMTFNFIERKQLLDQFRQFAKDAKYYKAGVEIREPVYSRTLSSLKTSWNESYGIAIENTMDNSPAKKGGLKPGDIIIEINGDKIYSIPECVDAFAYSKKPDETAVYIYRPTTKEYKIIKIMLEIMTEADLLFFDAAANDFQKHIE